MTSHGATSKSMNKRLKAKWLRALRSGEYAQGNGRLKDGKRYCCLGVLLAVKGGVEVGRYGLYGHLPAKHSCGLSDEIQETLAGMNDGRLGKPYSFTQIANFIEKNL